MKTTKRLIRGLKDISQFFASSEEKHTLAKELQEEEKKNVTVPQEEHSLSGVEKRTLLEGSPPPEPTKRSWSYGSSEGSVGFSFQGFSLRREKTASVSCLTILPTDVSHRLVKSKPFIDALQTVFSEVCVVSFSDDSNSNSHPHLLRRFAIPPFQRREILHPEPVFCSSVSESLGPGGRFCFIFEPESVLDIGSDAFRLMDQIVLPLSLDSSDSILAAYQLMSACLNRNPELRFSLLMEGVLRDEVLEMVYERFGRIASQFLGSEIDFLGWIEGEDVQLNSDLFIHNNRRLAAARLPMKTRLLKLLSEELLFEVA